MNNLNEREGKQKDIKHIWIIKFLTFPWCSLVVATRGSSATSRPKILRRPAVTTTDLREHKKKLCLEKYKLM